MTDEERIEQLQTELRTYRQLLRQTDDDASAASEGWDVDVTSRRDALRTSIHEAEARLAALEGGTYVAPQKVSDADHVRVADVEDALADLSEMASDADVSLADVLDAIADLSGDVSDLYAAMGGE